MGKGLRHRSCLVVERAAQITGRQKQEVLVPELVAGFQRLLKDPVKNDRGCVAKTAICAALREIGYDDHAFFLRGVRYVQMESGYGPAEDKAAELRAICGFALAETGYRDVIVELVDLLADPEKTARAGAARAIAWTNRPESESLLRLKVHVGDRESEVMGECFAGLLSVAPQRSLPIVGKYLNADDPAIRYEAAVAIGESRRPEALELLTSRAVATRDREDQRVLLMSLALLQNSEAVEFLFSCISDEDPLLAAAAVSALGHCRDRTTIRKRLTQMLGRRSHAAMEQAFRDAFG